jgi:RNase H-fold protein (predicted Holliday junction resolvase)
MALPISTTPTLKGKEAKRFLKKAKANEKRFASKKDVLRAIHIFTSVYKNNGQFFR